LQLASKNQLSMLRRLSGRRDARLESGLLVVEGSKVLAEALAAGVVVERVFVDEERLTPDDEGVVRVVDSAAVVGVAQGALSQVTDAITPQAVAALVKSPVADRLPPTVRLGLVVVGVDIRDPGNAGTMIRCAELSGAAAVCFLGTSVDVTSPKVVRSSAGAMFHVPVMQSPNTGEVLSELRARGVRCFGTAVHGEVQVYSEDGVLAGPVAVVLGNEARGLDPSLSSALDGWITIPMVGHTESLNVAMATAILCFEAARQN
jgi:RNA methyltransferase, TrmH family